MGRLEMFSPLLFQQLWNQFLNIDGNLFSCSLDSCFWMQFFSHGWQQLTLTLITQLWFEKMMMMKKRMKKRKKKVRKNEFELFFSIVVCYMKIKYSMVKQK